MRRPLFTWFVIVLAALVCAGLWLSGCGSFRSICATGEDFIGGACVCKPGHVPDDDGKGCHVPDAPTPTTTSTSTSTTTTTTTTTTTLPTPTSTTTTTLPPPTPAPCVPEPAMPSEPVSVISTLRGFVSVGSARLAPSSCEVPGENSKCFRSQPNGGPVPWEKDETSCWSYPHTTQAFLGSISGKVPVTHGGKAMLCETPNYPGADADSDARGCSDAYGRRVKWDGGQWREQTIDRFSGFWHGYCPPRAPKTCEPTPTPSPSPGASCSLLSMPECGGRQPDSEETHRWGCCLDSNHPQFPRSSPFSGVLEEVQAAEERDQTVRRDQDGRVDEDAYVNEILRRLHARGICAARSVNPSEEIGIKATNGENWQFDIVLGNGRPRRSGYVAYCRPARF